MKSRLVWVSSMLKYKSNLVFVFNSLYIYLQFTAFNVWGLQDANWYVGVHMKLINLSSLIWMY